MSSFTLGSRLDQANSEAICQDLETAFCEDFTDYLELIYKENLKNLKELQSPAVLAL